MSSIPFTKMHGAGNDYIYVDTRLYPLENPAELAVRWSAPHTGIGADGLVLIGPSEVADFSMRIFNADGSEAQMCGNATRCIGKYVYEKKLTDKTSLTLETLSGIKALTLNVRGDRVETVTVDMNPPVGGVWRLDVEAGMHCCTGTVVSMGNPHYVVFVEDLTKVDLEDAGPLIEHDPSFPGRTNVEFVEIKSPSSLRVRVWERGSGITLACGTGACASLVAAVACGKAGRQAEVEMDGGSLLIRWDEASGSVFMTGEAAFVYEGIIQI
jgi:diaminopimelate epimerase